MHEHTYTAIGIRTDFKRNTVKGVSVHDLLFVEPNGRINGPFSVIGYWLDINNIRRGQNFDGRWTVKTRTTPSGREIVESIEKED